MGGTEKKEVVFYKEKLNFADRYNVITDKQKLVYAERRKLYIIKRHWFVHRGRN
jgi:hypothetical protein